MKHQSIPYKGLCTEYYELDKPNAPEDGLEWYLNYAKEAKGPILEPMCGTGRFLIPILEKGYSITGFDYSSHMLEVCRKKCTDLHLNPSLSEATFETFSIPGTYDLIIIPSSSFCLLTHPKQVFQALQFISSRLNSGGKFVFEIMTLKAATESHGVWKGKWVDKEDGSKIVINTLSHFNANSKIETVLCRYELWANNDIVQTEVEDFRLKLYDPLELENLLAQHGLKVVNQWQAEPYVKMKPSGSTETILYECIKD